MGLWRLYNPDEIEQAVITGHYEPIMVIPAVFLAILSAMVLLPVPDRVSTIAGKARWLWLALLIGRAVHPETAQGIHAAGTRCRRDALHWHGSDQRAGQIVLHARPALVAAKH